MEWFRTLYPALHDSQLIAIRHGWSDLAWALAEALWAYYANSSRDRDAATVYRAALGAADDPKAMSQLSALLAMCLLKTGDLVEADQVLERAMDGDDDPVLTGILTLRLFEAHGAVVDAERVHRVLGVSEADGH
jgi:hypothetical protein